MAGSTTANTALVAMVAAASAVAFSEFGDAGNAMIGEPVKAEPATVSADGFESEAGLPSSTVELTNVEAPASATVTAVTTAGAGDTWNEDAGGGFDWLGFAKTAFKFTPLGWAIDNPKIAAAIVLGIAAAVVITVTAPFSVSLMVGIGIAAAFTVGALTAMEYGDCKATGRCDSWDGVKEGWSNLTYPVRHPKEAWDGLYETLLEPATSTIISCSLIGASIADGSCSESARRLGESVKGVAHGMVDLVLDGPRCIGGDERACIEFGGALSTAMFGTGAMNAANRVGGTALKAGRAAIKSKRFAERTESYLKAGRAAIKRGRASNKGLIKGGVKRPRTGAGVESMLAHAEPFGSWLEIPGGATAVRYRGMTTGKFLRTGNIDPSQLPYEAALRRPVPVSQISLPSTLDEAAGASLKRVHDVVLVSNDFAGSKGVVRLAELSDGRPVVIKTNHLGPTRTAEEYAAHMLQEVRSAQLISDLGIGPRFHGTAVDADGHLGLVMDVVPGDFTGPVVRQTLDDFDQIVSRLRAADTGLPPDDFQMYRTPSGRLQVIDPNDLSRFVGEKMQPGKVDQQRLSLLRDADSEVASRYLDDLTARDPESARWLRDHL